MRHPEPRPGRPQSARIGCRGERSTQAPLRARLLPQAVGRRRSPGVRAQAREHARQARQDRRSAGAPKGHRLARQPVPRRGRAACRVTDRREPVHADARHGGGCWAPSDPERPHRRGLPEERLGPLHPVAAVPQPRDRGAPEGRDAGDLAGGCGRSARAVVGQRPSSFW